MSGNPFNDLKSALSSHLFLVPLAVALLLFAAPGAGHARDITWTGCGVTQNAFMIQIAKAFEQKNGSKVVLTGGGATKGIRAASAGTSDMGGTCRPWLVDAAGAKNPQEQDAVLTQVAWDALVPIAHPGNPVENISLADLKKIYEGKITSWSQLGGPDKVIALITAEGKTSGVGNMFRKIVFGNPEYEYEARSMKVASASLVEKKVESTETAMGMTGISSAHKLQVKMLAIDGVKPTKENIASGAYPLFRPLYIATNKNSTPEARQVLDFILSEEGQKIVSAEGTVNLQEGKALEPLWAKKKSQMGL